MKKLTLDRPLACFDLETTGTNVAEDRIVEISIIKLMPDGTEEVLTSLVNPLMPIPKEASAVHGITDERVRDAPTFAQLGDRLVAYLHGCDLAGFNCLKFDVPILVEEFLRNGIEFSMKGRRVVDAQNIFHRMEQRTLTAAYRFYCDKNLDGAHSAEADTRATLEVIKAQVGRYDELQPDVQFLHDFSKRGNAVDFAGHIIENDKGQPIFNFGKFKGRAVVDVLREQPSYYSWMMDAQFPSYTKKVLTELRVEAYNKGLL